MLPAGCAGAGSEPPWLRRNQSCAASIISTYLIAIRAFSRLNRYLYRLGTQGSTQAFAELGHTSAQLALLVDRAQSPSMRRIAGLLAVSATPFLKAGSCPQSPWSTTTATFSHRSRSRLKPKATAP